MPALAELAEVEAPELAAIDGGECPRCHQAHGDDDRHCQHCGAALRRVCACGRPLRDDQQFCPACGKGAPAAVESAPPGAPLQLVPPGPVEEYAEWEPDDLFWVSCTVDAALVGMNGEVLDDKDRNRINKRACAVANKRFRIGGRWKEEISLGMAIAGAIFPTAYLYFVERKRKPAAESSTAERGT